MKDQIEEAGNHRSLGSAGTLELEVLVSTTVYVPLHLSREGRSSSQALWPTSKIAAAHSLPHRPEPILALNKGVSRINRASPHPASLHEAAPALWTLQAPAHLQLACKKHPAHRAYHRGCFLTVIFSRLEEIAIISN